MASIDVRVVALPSLLTLQDVAGQVVVVFDVLRATTTMTSALAAGVKELLLYATLDDARAGYRTSPPGTAVLAGETQCLKPDDFDFGNSPGQWGSACAGKVVHMATTNGTKAILSAYQWAAEKEGRPLAVLAGALVNRTAVAQACASKLPTFAGGGVTLLCAGTDGAVSFEDMLGCGAVLEATVGLGVLGKVNDAALLAMGAWSWALAGIVRAKEGEVAYPSGFRLARGASNVIGAGLAPDVAFAARPDVLTTVGQVTFDGKRATLKAMNLP